MLFEELNNSLVFHGGEEGVSVSRVVIENQYLQK